MRHFERDAVPINSPELPLPQWQTSLNLAPNCTLTEYLHNSEVFSQTLH